MRAFSTACQTAAGLHNSTKCQGERRLSPHAPVPEMLAPALLAKAACPSGAAWAFRTKSLRQGCLAHYFRLFFKNASILSNGMRSVLS